MAQRAYCVVLNFPEYSDVPDEEVSEAILKQLREYDKDKVTPNHLYRVEATVGDVSRLIFSSRTFLEESFTVEVSDKDIPDASAEKGTIDNPFVAEDFPITIPASGVYYFATAARVYRLN